MPEPLRCPLCHEVGKHAERCPGREQEKAPEPKQSKLEATVDDWAQRIASDIPKPQSFGWTPRLPVQTSDGGRVVGPDGRPAGMKSKVVVNKTGAELLWEEKLKTENCALCAHYSRDLFEDKDRAELAIFLQREAHWEPEAVQTILGDDFSKYGVCQAYSTDTGISVTHSEASCLHCFQPKAKGWIRSLAGHIYGGSRRSGF